MKIQANFYTNEEETPIFSMYDLSAIPFKVGDKINLEVEDLYPVDYNIFKEDVQIKMLENSKEHRSLFNRKTIKIVNSTLRAGTMTIEYHCEILP